jgi:hypothetical protein
MQRKTSAIPAINRVRPPTKMMSFSGQTGTPAGLFTLDSRIRVASNEYFAPVKTIAKIAGKKKIK